MLTFQQTVGFLLRGVGGSTTNDHEFPFSGDVEFVERSLRFNGNLQTLQIIYYYNNILLMLVGVIPKERFAGLCPPILLFV